MSMYENNLLTLKAKDKVCTALGVKLVSGGEIVQIAKSAGYDSLFIDTEHTILTIRDVGQLCITALTAGVTPFVRVPHQCGDGQIQKILDAGAMGVIIPHIHNSEDAKRAINVSKYPPVGGRSLTGMLPQFDLKPVSTDKTVELVNGSGSTVFIMVETADALRCVEDLAALPGCDVLLVGSQDLSSEIGILGDWDSPKFIEALKMVGKAATQHGKIFGIAGLYHRPDILDTVVNEFGARWVVGAHDTGLLYGAANANNALIRSIQRK